MNYATPYTPNYAPAYAQSYDPNAYAQAQQHAAALEQMQQYQQYPMVYTGQAVPPPMATQPKLTPLQGAWWQEPMYGVPRWGIAAGVAALTGIGLAWKAGVFGGKSSMRTTTRTTARRSTARDANMTRKTSASAYGDERDMTRTTTRTRSRRRPSASRGRSVARNY